MIYLDNNATTRPDLEVVTAMYPYWTEQFFNPASMAGELMGVSAPITVAKRALADLIGCEPDEIILTSGATEANNWALQSTARQSLRNQGACKIFVSAIEHPSVLEVAHELESENPRVQVTLIPVTKTGQIDLSMLPDLISPDSALVSIMLVNNESGVIQPVACASEIIKQIAPRCLIHCDATQAVGKIPVDLANDLRLVDILSLSAHKFHGPKGIGALFIRNGVSLPPLIYGGGQQGGARAGTENPALAAGLAKAAEIALTTNYTQKNLKLRELLEGSLSDLKVSVLGKDAPRTPNTSLILFPGIDAEMLVHQLLERGVVVSTGSACSSRSDTPSHVVLAMGIDYGEAFSVLRVSFGNQNTAEEVDVFLRAIHDILKV